MARGLFSMQVLHFDQSANNQFLHFILFIQVLFLFFLPENKQPFQKYKKAYLFRMLFVCECIIILCLTLIMTFNVRFERSEFYDIVSRHRNNPTKWFFYKLNIILCLTILRYFVTASSLCYKKQTIIILRIEVRS